ncbi:protein kinase family protein [Nocardioides nanhaiensis]|uniref:non-specific serine/threonine protein kinase n=1 Tax=Nocardioides nanhaiensis TaxID=1476871 RepID=A0ABP8VPA0_9ACTN
MPHSTRSGDVLAGRYRLVDLLDESGGARFWRAHDRILQRYVALHVIPADDERSSALLEAARRSATVLDPRLLRVLDAERDEAICYVVNEWGDGVSLDILVASRGPVAARQSAWLVGQVAEGIATAHAAGVAHGRLVPENVLVDRHGEVKIIGLCVDAAMHGRAGDRAAADVADLAGLLYCALTGRWPGGGGSAVPAAPEHHGHALRPRRVRAGIPGQLDALCDEVLRAQHHTHRAEGLGSARGIADLLADYVGSPAGMAESWRAVVPALLPGSRTTALPPLPPDPAPHDAEPDPTPEPELPPTEAVTAPLALPTEPAPDAGTQADPDAPTRTVGTVSPPATSPIPPTPATEPETEPVPAPEVATELPTEAGLPIFGEEPDDVSWLSKRSQPVPPPPPFEEPPERPLFAPEPDDGEPHRRRRPGAAPPPERDPDGYWPWEATGAGATGDSRVSAVHTGTGSTRAVPAEEEVPGRTALRVAGIIGAAVLLLVAVVVAYNLGRGRTPLGAEPAAPESSASATEQPEAPPETGPLTGLVATDLDPQGEDGDENGDDAPLAVDGDPTTSWSTSTYEQQLGPGGLKTGVGLVVDLGAEREVTAADLTLVGSPTGVALYLTSEEPTDVEGLTPVAGATAEDERLQLSLEEPATGRYLVVWLTSLPNDGSGWRGTVAEVAVEAVLDGADGADGESTAP